MSDPCGTSSIEFFHRKPRMKIPLMDPRVPRWDLAALITRSCPLCSAGESSSIATRPDDLEVVRCDGCGMFYIKKIPSPAQLEAFYHAYAKTHQRRGFDASRAIRQSRRRRGRNALLWEIDVLRPLKGARLLEIGCSTGGLLLDAKERGATVFGVEIDGTARGFVDRQLGIRCFEELGGIPSDLTFDIVIAMNLIEHLPDPKAWIASIYRRVSPGGLLALWTPNGGQADELAAGWVGFRVDLDHLNYFSKRTLGRLLVQASFWPEAVWTFKQAAIGGFTRTPTAVRRSLLERAMHLLCRRNAEDGLPTGGGGYTLCMLAGKGCE